MKKRLTILFVLTLSLGIFIGDALAAATVRIGAVLPLTGPLAMAGQRVKNVISFAVDEVNAQGGIKALGGAKLDWFSGIPRANPRWPSPRWSGWWKRRTPSS